MTTKNDGGPAFPRLDTESSCGAEGMTLRDWFAGQVMAGSLADGSCVGMDAKRVEGVSG